MSSRESPRDSNHQPKGHHGIHLHIPKPGRSVSSGRISPISLFRRGSKAGHENGNGNGHGNSNDRRNSGGIRDSVSAPNSSHVSPAGSAPNSSHGSPTGSPTHSRKGSFGSAFVVSFVCSTESQWGSRKTFHFTSAIMSGVC